MTSPSSLPARTLEQIVSIVERDLLNPIIRFFIVLAFVVFIWGLLQFVMKSDDAEGREAGKRHIIWGLVGIVIMLSAFGIINLLATVIR